MKWSREEGSARACRTRTTFLSLFPTYASVPGSPLPVPPSYPATACFLTPPQSLLREGPPPRSQPHSCSSHHPGLRAAQLPSPPLLSEQERTARGTHGLGTITDATKKSKCICICGEEGNVSAALPPLPQPYCAAQLGSAWHFSPPCK